MRKSPFGDFRGKETWSRTKEKYLMNKSIKLDAEGRKCTWLPQATYIRKLIFLHLYRKSIKTNL